MSCIPTRIAPTIKEDTILKGKRLNRQLKHQPYFVFENKKGELFFYEFLDAKIIPKDYPYYLNVPIKIADNNYFISFNSVEGKDQRINVGGAFLSAIFNEAVNADVFETYVIVHNNYYLYVAIKVMDEENNNCLAEDYLHREVVLKYLRDLRIAYIHSSF
jgi:hypothetical protein